MTTTQIMTEVDVCRELVTPKLVDAGWGSAPHAIGEQRTFTNKAKQFDTALSLLGEDIVRQREMVRRTLASFLPPDLPAPNATATHETLLTAEHWF